MKKRTLIVFCCSMLLSAAMMGCGTNTTTTEDVTETPKVETTTETPAETPASEPEKEETPEATTEEALPENPIPSAADSEPGVTETGEEIYAGITLAEARSKTGTGSGAVLDSYEKGQTPEGQPAWILCIYPVSPEPQNAPDIYYVSDTFCTVVESE
ncbi:MAG: hypothetical protein K6G04_02960 [Lachnospiraceae bacterium]|nr:hypothetical protein [Lachnospiraceae bacterium]